MKNNNIFMKQKSLMYNNHKNPTFKYFRINKNVQNYRKFKFINQGMNQDFIDMKI